MTAAGRINEKTGEWFWHYFALKFRSGNLPKPSDMLIGERLVVMVEMPDGELVRWPVTKDDWQKHKDRPEVSA